MTPVIAAATSWGPVGVWAGAAATTTVAAIALLAGTGQFERRNRPRLRLVHEPTEPWCRRVITDHGATTWLRVSVENYGREPARGCIGRLTGVRSDAVTRSDVDPVQLRWAGTPRSIAFNPVDVRRGQREYLDVVYRENHGPWQIDTFYGPDFDPGFPTTLDPRHHHRLTVELYGDNTDTTSLEVDLAPIET